MSWTGVWRIAAAAALVAVVVMAAAADAAVPASRFVAPRHITGSPARVSSPFLAPVLSAHKVVRGVASELAATQRMLGAAVTNQAARRAEREALDGKPTTATALRD